jgi:hypothetical protein
LYRVILRTTRLGALSKAPWWPDSGLLRRWLMTWRTVSTSSKISQVPGDSRQIPGPAQVREMLDLAG